MTISESSNFSRPPLLTQTSGNLLTHASLSQTSLTPLQSQVDGLVGGFTQQATDWRSLAAMMVGGMAYRAGRIGVMSTGLRGSRILSMGLGLGAEVTAFEMSHRSLTSLTGESSLNPNLWRWEGQGGIRQGLLSSLITFGSLKGAGRLAQGENVVVQHLLQDTGMVLGHQVSGTLGITERPQGTLAEQFLHAEVTNLQLGAGVALAHGIAPGIQGLERGLDLSLRLTDIRSGQAPLQNGLQPAFAAPVGDISILEDSSSRSEDPIQGPLVMEMSGPKDGGKDRKPRITPDSGASASPGAPIVPTTRSRDQIRHDLKLVTKALGDLSNLYERTLEGLRILIRQNRRNAENWEIYDRLLLRHSFLSRKHQIGASALVPGGGAEKWNVSRMEQVVLSLQRALGDSEEFFEDIKMPSLPPVPDRPSSVSAKSWEETVRMFRQLRLEPGLTRRFLKVVIPERRRNDHMILVGLEGLNGLLNERPKDERQAIVGLLESIAQGNGSGFEMLHQLLILTMNFQSGLLSRSEVMGVIREARDFHGAYPNARGPFLELFSRRFLVGSREAMAVNSLLNFARDHLDRGKTVVLEPRSSIHQGTMLVGLPAGEWVRYAVGGFFRELKDYFQFETFVQKMARELIKAREGDLQGPTRYGIYIEVPKLGRDVGPERLLFWGRQMFERAVSLVLHELTQTNLSEVISRYDKKERTEELIRDLQESVRQYWNAFSPGLEQIEISCGEDHERRQVEMINAGAQTSEQMIQQLQMEIAGTDPRDPNLPKRHLLLAHMLRDAGRKAEAVEFLRMQLGKQPHKRIREFYRDLYREGLEDLFELPGGRSIPDHPIESKPVLDFLSSFFDADLNAPTLRSLLQVQHPLYELGTVTAERTGDALRLVFPVIRLNFPNSESMGEFLVDVNLPFNEPRLVAQLARANIAPEFRNKGAAVFVMDRIFALFRALKVPELRVEAEDEGKYAWLRMGAEFIKPEERQLLAQRLLLYGNLNFPPNYEPRTAPTPLLVQLLASLERYQREEFIHNNWFGSPLYRFSLDDGSPELGRFRQYFALKQRQSYPPGPEN